MRVGRLVRVHDAGKAAELSERTVKFQIAQQRHVRGEKPRCSQGIVSLTAFCYCC
jgi:hypothetical protein